MTKPCCGRMVPALKERGLREYGPFRDDYGSETAVEMFFTDEEKESPEEQTSSDPVENRNEIAR